MWYGDFTGKLCIEVTPASRLAFISEELCIGCGICVKVCLLLLYIRMELGYVFVL